MIMALKSQNSELKIKLWQKTEIMTITIMTLVEIMWQSSNWHTKSAMTHHNYEIKNWHTVIYDEKSKLWHTKS